jgi:hypothetical protein
MPSSGVLRRVALVTTDFSEEPSASIVRVTRIGELGKTLAVTGNRRTWYSFAKPKQVLQHSGVHRHEPTLNDAVSDVHLFSLSQHQPLETLTFQESNFLCPFVQKAIVRLISSCRLRMMGEFGEVGSSTRL